MIGLGLSFKVFVLAALVAAWRQRRSEAPTPSLHAFLGIAVLASLLPMLTQSDQWPFSTWPLVAARPPSPVVHLRLMGTDAGGREYDVDYRAFAPLSFDELMSWLQGPFERLSAPGRDEALSFLLNQAEAARRRARASGLADRWPLGRLEAPLFILHPRRWDDLQAVPDMPFVALRLYRESWDPEARARGAGVARVLAYEGKARP